jgi:hypothetical protein
MKYYNFAVTCNGEKKTYQIEAKTFKSAIAKLFTYYKSFKLVEFIGTCDKLSEAIMACVDYDEKNKIRK